LECEDCPSGALAVSVAWVAWQSHETRRVKFGQVCWLGLNVLGPRTQSRGASVTFFFGGDTAWCGGRLQVCRRLVVTSGYTPFRLIPVSPNPVSPTPHSPIPVSPNPVSPNSSFAYSPFAYSRFAYSLFA
jgi:hypothetical protein